MTENISVILCTYNEASVIEKTINKINDVLPEGEIIIIDDNSSDGTQNIIKKLSLKNLKLIERKSRGLASACMVGLIFSNNEVVCWIDSNQPNLATEIPKMISNLKDDNIVVMSRYVQGGGDLRSKKRILTSKIINYFCRIILDSSIKDYTSGIFVMKKKILIDVIPFCYGHGEYFIEFLYSAKNKGYKILELPFVQPEDLEGISKTAGSIFRFMRLGISYFLRILISRLKRQ